jgi:hypothetical protein
MNLIHNALPPLLITWIFLLTIHIKIENIPESVTNIYVQFVGSALMTWSRQMLRGFITFQQTLQLPSSGFNDLGRRLVGLGSCTGQCAVQLTSGGLEEAGVLQLAKNLNGLHHSVPTDLIKQQQKEKAEYMGKR